VEQNDLTPRRLGRKRIARNRVWDIIFEHIANDDHEVRDYLVVEPLGRGLNKVGGVAVLPVLDGRIGLLSVHRVAVDSLLPLGSFTPDASTIAARGLLFAATKCHGTTKFSSDEIGLGALEFYSPTDIRAMVENSTIEDAATLVAIYRYLTHL
jgi:ADP-ribose pyrophosphatase